MDKYKVLIGLEMHCEISETNTKVFSSSANSFSDTPNTNVRPLDMAFPGILPLLNKECMEKAIEMALILNCKIPDIFMFDRSLNSFGVQI